MAMDGREAAGDWLHSTYGIAVPKRCKALEGFGGLR
jgi:hypothetical protein